MFDERGTKGERRKVPPLAVRGEPVSDRIAEIAKRYHGPHPNCAGDVRADVCYLLDENARLSTALDSATRERDEALAQVARQQSKDRRMLRAIFGGGDEDDERGEHTKEGE